MAKRLKVPKRVAGVKIPKAIRKGPVGDFLNSSAGQLLLAEVLLAAGGILAGRRVDEHSDLGELLHHPGRGMKAASRALSGRGDAAKGEVQDNSARLAHAFNEAVRAFRAALHEDDSARQAPGQDAGNVMTGDLEPASDPAKKKSGGSRPESSTTPH
jgi:hypothetical protein